MVYIPTKSIDPASEGCAGTSPASEGCAGTSPASEGCAGTSPASAKGCAETSPASLRYAGTSKEALLSAVRDAVNAAGGHRVTEAKFLEDSGMMPRDIYRYFATWTEALRAAGFSFEGNHGKIEPERLLADWGSVVRKLNHLPTQREYEIHGEFGLSIFRNNFGGWAELPGAFRTFAAGRADWKDVLLLVHPSCRAMRILKARKRGRAWARCRERIPRRFARIGGMRTAPRSNGRAICGGRLEIGPLRHSPVNEQGVLFLFALVAEQLGFLIEGIRVGFPDCEAKRRVGPDAWQGVNIEFEYESRNFRIHGHEPEGCDIIVCWIHNWPECPPNLEVIELREEIKRLAVGQVHPGEG